MAKENQNEIRVRGVSGRVAGDLQNIAKNTGITLTDFLKFKFREIVESYPPHMKKAPSEE
jgi:hypothetical protein